MEEEYKDYKFICKTVQSNAIKTLFEALKDILDDVNLKISPESIQILSVDPNKCCIVHLKLLHSQFEVYHCKTAFNIGFKMKNLFLLLKTVANNDVITFSVTKKEDTRLNIVIENKEKHMRDISKLKLFDFDEDEYIIPDMDIDTAVQLPSNDFQKICKDLSNIADTVRIENRNNSFRMYVDGDIGEKEMVLVENEKNKVIVKQLTNENVSEEFALKYLLSFVKSSNLCTTVELLLKKEYPLILIYSAGSLGSLKFLLSPLEQSEF